MILVDGFARYLLDRRPSGQVRLIRLVSFLSRRLLLYARLIINAE
jgi:hypothetical protein